eukprot:1994943-Rhodomonas_salina.2
MSSRQRKGWGERASGGGFVGGKVTGAAADTSGVAYLQPTEGYLLPTYLALSSCWLILGGGVVSRNPEEEAEEGVQGTATGQ